MKALQIFLGAEAADLDSFACVQVMALRFKRAGYTVRPLLETKQEQLLWRDDIAALLKFLAEQGWSGLECSNDGFKEQLLKEANIHLVDRHHLPPSWLQKYPYLEKRVQTIYDHRPDSGTLMHVKQRCIAKLASCATLLFEKAQVQSNYEAFLLSAAILQDSQFLKSPQCQERDRKAVQELGLWLTQEQWMWLQQLPHYRMQVRNRPLEQQLQLDLKWLKHSSLNLPVVTLQLSVEELWSRENAPRSIKKVLFKEAEPQLAFILHKPPGFTLPQLSIYKTATSWPNWVQEFIDDSQVYSKILPKFSSQDLYILEFNNSKLTRKDIIFCLTEILNS